MQHLMNIIEKYMFDLFVHGFPPHCVEDVFCRGEAALQQSLFEVWWTLETLVDGWFKGKWATYNW